MTRERCQHLDVGRGMTMISLVVFHVVNKTFPQGNDWYVILYKYITLVQMPLFFYFTGMVMTLSAPRIRSVAQYVLYCRKRVMKFVFIFFIFGAIIFLGKLLVQQYLPTDRPITSGEDILTLFLTPKISLFASYLWFIYVLAVYTLIWPFFLPLLERFPWFYLAVAVVLSLVPASELFASKYILRHLPHMVLGAILWNNRDTYMALLDRYGLLFFFFFLFLAWITLHVEAASRILPFAAFPAAHWLCRLKPVMNNHFVRLGAKYMLPIYLLNTIPLNVLRGIILMVWTWDGPAFFVVLPLLFMAGFYLPILAAILFDHAMARIRKRRAVVEVA